MPNSAQLMLKAGFLLAGASYSSSWHMGMVGWIKCNIRLGMKCKTRLKLSQLGGWGLDLAELGNKPNL